MKYKVKYLSLILSALIVSTSYAAEKITLSSSYVADPRTATEFYVESVLFNWKDKKIVIHLGNGVIQRVIEYVDTAADPKATNLMVALNKANLTSNSLHKRILNQLISDGYIAGTISGSTD